jgi:hypothetical protein
VEPRQTRRDTRAETTPPHHEEKDSGGYAEQQDDNSPTGLKHLNDVVLTPEGHMKAGAVPLDH